MTPQFFSEFANQFVVLVARIQKAGCECVVACDCGISCGLFEADGQPQTVARRFPTPAREIASALGLPWRFPRLFAWADVEDLVADVGYRPATSVEDGVARFVDWYLSYYGEAGTGAA